MAKIRLTKEDRMKQIEKYPRGYKGVLSPEETIKFFNSYYAYIMVGGKPIFLDKETGMLTSFRGINTLHERVLTRINKNSTDNAAKYWRRNVEILQGMAFDTSTLENRDKYNLWKGYGVEPTSTGNCSLLLEHLQENIFPNPAHLEYFMNWAAHLVQKPEQKIGTAIAIGGAPGTGKSTVVNVLRKLFHRNHSIEVKKLKDLDRRFNGNLKDKVLIACEETDWQTHRDGEGFLKGLITSPNLDYEEKGEPSYEGVNYINLILTSNESRMAPVGKRDRRYAMFTAENHRAMDAEYFIELKDQLENESGYGKFLDILLNRDISHFNPEDIPYTPIRHDHIYQGLTATEKYIYVSLVAGGVPAEKWDGTFKYTTTNTIDKAISNQLLLFGKLPEEGGMIEVATLYEDYREWLKRNSGLKDSAKNEYDFVEALKKVLGTRLIRLKNHPSGAKIKYLRIPHIRHWIKLFEQYSGMKIESYRDAVHEQIEAENQLTLVR